MTSCHQVLLLHANIRWAVTHRQRVRDGLAKPTLVQALQVFTKESAVLPAHTFEATNLSPAAVMAFPEGGHPGGALDNRFTCLSKRATARYKMGTALARGRVFRSTVTTGVSNMFKRTKVWSAYWPPSGGACFVGSQAFAQSTERVEVTGSRLENLRDGYRVADRDDRCRRHQGRRFALVEQLLNNLRRSSPTSAARCPTVLPAPPPSTCATSATSERSCWSTATACRPAARAFWLLT